MKFGSNLQQSQIPEWAAYYIDYKSLKKLIKSIKERSPEQTTDDDAAGESQLISLLDRNLDKIHDFYVKRYAAFARQLRVLKDANDSAGAVASMPTDRDALQELRVSLFELREHYRKLQWYSEVNRRGFTKITKKINKNFSDLAANKQYLETKVDPKPFAFHTDLLADVVYISDWLARVESQLAVNATPSDRTTDVSSPETAAGSANPLDRLDEPPIDIDTAIKTDDVGALRQHILLALRQPSPPHETRYILSLLQRAINATSYACVTLLLSRAPTLTVHDMPEQRNCLHKYLIHIGRLKLSASLAKRGAQNTSMASRLIDKQTTDDDQEDKFDQVKTTNFLRHIVQGLPDSQRPALMSRDVYGRTPLHYAAEYGLLTASQVIISQLKSWGLFDTSINADGEHWQDLEGHAPMHLAVLGQHPKTTATLLSAETCDDFDFENIAARERNEMTISILVFAVRMRMPVVTRLLVLAGADMNGQNDQGETTLHHAARRGYSDCLEALLIGSSFHQARLEIRDKTYGFTPVFHACVEGHATCVDMMVRAGANLDTFDQAGWRPIEHAAWNGHFRIAKKLHDLPAPSRPAPEPAFGVPRYARASLEAGLGLPRKTLKSETMILVSLGSMDLRNPMPAVVLQGIERSVQQDTALSLVVSIEGGSGSAVTVDLPTTDDLSCFPITFMAADPARVRILFDIVPTRAPKESRRLIARAVGQPSSVMPVMGPKMMTLQGFLRTPILSASTLDVVGNVSFNFLVIKPFAHPPADDARFRTPNLKGTGSTMIIGHRGWGMNVKDKNRIQVGENTLTAFQIAHKLGVPFVEFDVQLTKDHVPVVYHDFLVSETGMDAPVHTLTLEQFLHAGDSNEEPEDEHEISSRSSSTDGTVSPPLQRRFRSKSTSLSGDRRERRLDMDHRMKYTLDYKRQGYKPNSRGKVIHDKFATLEKLLIEVPEALGLNIEFKFPMLHEAEEFGMETYHVELNAFADAVLEVLYKPNMPAHPVVLSSFHPDLCVLLVQKQPHFPVMFLTDAGCEPAGDIRAGSIREAIRFATRWNLAGICCNVDPLSLCPRLIRVLKQSGLAVCSWGPRNCDPACVRMQVREGIDAVIADDVQAVRKEMEVESRPTSADGSK